MFDLPSPEVSRDTKWSAHLDPHALHFVSRLTVHCHAAPQRPQFPRCCTPWRAVIAAMFKLRRFLIQQTFLRSGGTDSVEQAVFL